MQHLNFLDLFSGIGGFRLGMEEAGNHCVGWCDIDKYARKSYLNMYPHAKKEWHAGDIRKVTNNTWKKLNQRYHIDVICGGFPCQTFSVAGERKGFLDKVRGTLFFQIARVVNIIHPPYIFMENVKGLLNHNKGKTFATILSTLDKLGYDVEWHVFNSRCFGVPQNRERVYIIAHYRKGKTATIFNKEDCLESNPQNISMVNSVKENDVSLDKLSYFYNARKHGKYGTYDIIKPNGISKTLRANRQDNNIAVRNKIKYFHYGKHQSKNIFDDTGLAPTVDATTYKHKPLISHQDNVAMACLTPFRVNKRQEGRRFKNNQEPMFTLNTIDRDGVLVAKQLQLNTLPKSAYTLLPKSKIKSQKSGLIFVGFLHGNHRHKGTKPNQKFDSRLYKMPQRIYSAKGVSPTLSAQEIAGRYYVLTYVRVRKLTPIECWRLQGYPDWLFNRAKAVNSNSQLYKQAGNSVTVGVMYWIAKRFKIYKK